MTINPEGYDFLPKEQITFYSIEFLIPFILITLIIFYFTFFFKKTNKKLIPFLELILFLLVSFFLYSILRYRY